MPIQEGSKVKFLNDVGGGIIKSFVGENLALVETDDGFEITVSVNELLPESGSSYDVVESKKSNSIDKPVQKPEISYEEKKYIRFEGEAFLAIVPQNENILHVSNFGLYLLNTSTYTFFYSVLAGDTKIRTLVKTGIVKPESRLEIEIYSQTSISKIKEFALQGVFFKHGLLDYTEPVNQSFDIADVSFYKIAFFNENEYFKQKALILKRDAKKEMEEAINKLKSGDFQKIAEHKEKKEEKKEFKTPKPLSIQEVDLHIEEILETTSGLSNAEILEAQMARFETALQTAMKGNTQKIVFIHGVGNGRLRQELRKKLDRSYNQLKYQDASFKEYGYGATLVYLK